MAAERLEVVLLSIRPEYADAILDGKKLVEFRRTRFSREVAFVVIYATQPVGKVVGWFEVGGIEESSPAELWTRFSACGGISEQKFHDYYSGAETGFAIRVKQAKRFPRARQLKAVSGLEHAPQSFAYLAAKKARSALKMALTK
jgi:predicted transcriptional regulator